MLRSVARTALSANVRNGGRRVVNGGVKRWMGDQGVKRVPIYERWNSVRDNIDLSFDLFKGPATFASTLFFGFGVPYLLYAGMMAEGMCPNGDDSTGVKFNHEQPWGKLNGLHGGVYEIEQKKTH
eukprot:CAMPEP_0196757440 /NCGR_PEP_ID=MMETSP1091-20130531/103663_1 /TAXON_ID=302021 /ORGANISM="Rhodomonas sp., Strain CCMP768" /LENGTH=124 /DNA_ID=CAMNT_0042106215 /DNA_START=420 /DNA_END=794 /DNA_ORIENTATION=-